MELDRKFGGQMYMRSLVLTRWLKSSGKYNWMFQGPSLWRAEGLSSSILFTVKRIRNWETGI